MPIRDDWLVKKIEKLVVALLSQRRQRRDLDGEPALETSDDLLREWAGMPAVLLERLDGAGLVDAMSPGGVLDLNRAIGVGLILEEMGDPRAAGVLAAAAAAGGAADIEALRARLAR